MKILLIGQMGSGKDTAAKYLIDKYQLYPEKLGTHIRKHVDEMFFDVKTDQRRNFYQAYGEGMREIFGPLFWCERLDARLTQNISLDLYYNGIIITDARQDHEIEHFKKQGYVLIGIKTDTASRMNRLTKRDGANFDIESFTHYTEENAARIIERIQYRELDGYIASNHSDEHFLYTQLDNIVKQIQCSGVTV